MSFRSAIIGGLTATQLLMTSASAQMTSARDVSYLKAATITYAFANQPADLEKPISPAIPKNEVLYNEIARYYLIQAARNSGFAINADQENYTYDSSTFEKLAANLVADTDVQNFVRNLPQLSPATPLSYEVSDFRFAGSALLSALKPGVVPPAGNVNLDKALANSTIELLLQDLNIRFSPPYAGERFLPEDLVTRKATIDRSADLRSAARSVPFPP